MDDKKGGDFHSVLGLLGLIVGVVGWKESERLSASDLTFLTAVLAGVIGAIFVWLLMTKSVWAKARKKRLERLTTIPFALLQPSTNSVLMGLEKDMEEKIYLPDSVRTRHVHIVGATGSGKTESVILNFLRQDVSRGLGAIILDAKADASFLAELKRIVPTENLRVFDLASEDSLPYNPLEDGNHFESAQRLFSSLTWSEEYYRSKALSALQRIFSRFRELHKRNPKLTDVADYLESQADYSSLVCSENFPKAAAVEEFKDLAGLRDQVRSLVTGHLAKCSLDLAKTQFNSPKLSPVLSSTSVCKVSCRQNWSRLLDAS